VSQLDLLRQKLLNKAKEAATSSRNPLEFTPDIGEVKIRILPSIDPEDLFYYTHSYHYIPLDGGKYVYSKKEYIIDGQRKKCPIDEAVSQWYSLAKREEDKEIFSIAGTAKRKRHYFMNILLVDEPDPEKKFRILVDRSNDGKLISRICKIMGITFFRDIEDNWVDKNSLNIDEDADYYDLIDIDAGHDLKIKKVQVGQYSWDISYIDSVAVKKIRPLTDEEKKLLDKRINLKSYIAYEENYANVVKILDNYIGTLPLKKSSSVVSTTIADEQDEDEDVSTDVAKPAPLKPVKQTKKQYSEDEIDSILGELDDDDGAKAKK
jgi:hypothetical protein